MSRVEIHKIVENPCDLAGIAHEKLKESSIEMREIDEDINKLAEKIS